MRRQRAFEGFAEARALRERQRGKSGAALWFYRLVGKGKVGKRSIPADLIFGSLYQDKEHRQSARLLTLLFAFFLIKKQQKIKSADRLLCALGFCPAGQVKTSGCIICPQRSLPTHMAKDAMPFATAQAICFYLPSPEAFLLTGHRTTFCGCLQVFETFFKHILLALSDGGFWTKDGKTEGLCVAKGIRRFC